MNIHYSILAFEPKDRVFIVRYQEESSGEVIELNLPMPLKDGILLEGIELDVFINTFAPSADFAYAETLKDLDASSIHKLIPPVPPPTTEEVASMMLSYVDDHLNTTARERYYDDMFSICTYGDTGNLKFDAEAKAFKLWRSQVWDSYYALQDEVLAGKHHALTKESLIALLPKIQWPS